MSSEQPQRSSSNALLVICVVAGIVVLATVNAISTPEKKNDQERKFFAVVERVRKICTNNGSCVYDLKVRRGGWSYSLTTPSRFDMEVGDKVVMVKVHHDEIIAPSRRRRSKGAGFHYELVANADR